MEIIVGGVYKLTNRIGCGSFGEIYRGVDDKNNPVAIKLEKERPHCRSLLRHEAKLYQILQDTANIPKFYWHGSQGGYNIIVLEMLDKTLEDLKVECGGSFSLKTVLMLADQLISCLEFIHKKGFIHRDLKPENFMIGRADRSRNVFGIDLGLSKTYIDPKTQQHIPMGGRDSLTGTARYASVNAMKCMEQSRRDDMESLAYMLIYFLKGELPWQGLPGTDKKTKLDNIRNVKEGISSKELCKDLPPEFRVYLDAVKDLKFTEEPKYAEYRKLFRDLFINYRFIYDYQYDWIKKRAKDAAQKETASVTPIRPKLPGVGSPEITTPSARARARGPVTDRPKPLLVTGESTREKTVRKPVIAPIAKWRRTVQDDLPRYAVSVCRARPLASGARYSYFPETVKSKFPQRRRFY